ncbi:MAG: hypothetical protein VX546_06190 [Myxococcota bacterium]|nr:hypothetical protein [Myxococcota bacterium]
MEPRSLLRIAMLVVALWSGTATAAPPPGTIHGEYCTPAGCAGSTSSAVGQLAAFGLALGITLRASRRRRSGTR